MEVLFAVDKPQVLKCNFNQSADHNMIRNPFTNKVEFPKCVAKVRNTIGKNPFTWSFISENTTTRKINQGTEESNLLPRYSLERFTWTIDFNEEKTK